MAFGECPLCPPGSRHVLLIGGLCNAHFNGETVERNAAPDKKGAKRQKSMTLTAWYNLQLATCPKLCENCGQPIYIPPHLPERTKVCHILPKSKFPSVATHPLNRFFGDWQCHTNFDNWPAHKVAAMPVIAICIERVKVMMPLLPPEERRRVPEYLIAS